MPRASPKGIFYVKTLIMEGLVYGTYRGRLVFEGSLHQIGSHRVQTSHETSIQLGVRIVLQVLRIPISIIKLQGLAQLGELTSLTKFWTT